MSSLLLTKGLGHVKSSFTKYVARRQIVRTRRFGGKGRISWKRAFTVVGHGTSQFSFRPARHRPRHSHLLPSTLCIGTLCGKLLRVVSPCLAVTRAPRLLLVSYRGCKTRRLLLAKLCEQAVITHSLLEETSRVHREPSSLLGERRATFS